VSLLGVIGTPRLLLVLAAGCLVPGAALLTQLVSEDLLSAFALAIGLSLGIEATGALAMVWTGWWHPSGFALAVLALSCIALSWDALCALRPANGSEG
jgi:hypothetical protein